MCIWQSVFANPKDDGSFRGVLYASLQCVSTAVEWSLPEYKARESSRAFLWLPCTNLDMELSWKPPLLILNFGCISASKFLFPDAAMKKLCYPERCQWEIVGNIRSAVRYASWFNGHDNAEFAYTQHSL